MQVILIERVEKLGVPGEIVEVKRGYARNWLLPQRKALIATDENKIIAEKEKKLLVARDNAKKAEAETVKRVLNDKRVFLIRAAGESGQLYGSVRDLDIAQEIEKQLKILVSKKFIVLQQPIRTLGITEVKIALHPQVDIRIEVNVAQSEDEAKAQAIKHDDEIAKQIAKQIASQKDAEKIKNAKLNEKKANEKKLSETKLGKNENDASGNDASLKDASGNDASEESASLKDASGNESKADAELEVVVEEEKDASETEK